MTAFLLSTALCLAGADPKPEPTLDEQGAKVREKAIDFLKKQQNKAGTWEGAIVGILVDMDGGQTALVTLALLEAGVPANDAAIAKAVDYLVQVPPKKTYVVSLQTQVLARVDAKKHKQQIQKNVSWLMETVLRSGDKLEGWSYPANQIADGSNTHFAVMGLHAADGVGVKVDEKVWRQVRETYVRTQTVSGWSYYSNNPGDRPSRSMTTVALVGLTIAGKHDGSAKGPDPAFEKGLKVIVSWDLENQKSTAYALMVVAELGRAVGTTEFKVGDRTWAWYREGVEKLAKIQKEDGSVAMKAGLDANPVLATAFALYFLGPPPAKK